MIFSGNRETAGVISIRQFFQNRKNIINLLAIPLVIYTVWLLWSIGVSMVTEYDVPNEYREVVNIQLTKTILSGRNPYSPEYAFGGEKPGMVFLYGPLYSLITAFFALWLPIDIFLLHYLVSYLAMLAGAAFAALIVKDHTQTVTAPAAAFLFLINCSWRYGYLNAVPDTTALMLMMLVLFVETRKKCRYRELIEALLIIAIFFTKQYIICIVFPLFLLKLIRDRKAALRFVLSGVISFAVIAGIVTLTCPLFWTYSIYLVHGPWGISEDEFLSVMNKTAVAHLSAGQVRDAFEVLTFQNEKDPLAGLGYEVLQLRTLIGTFLFFFLSAILSFILQLRNRFRGLSDFHLLMILTFLSSLPVLFVLGRNGGAWLSYYLQIQMPPLIMYALVCTEAFCLKDEVRPATFGWFAILLLMLFFTLMRTDKRLPNYRMTASDRQLWDETYELLDTYAAKGEIYYMPPLGFHAERAGRYYYNNGHVMVIDKRFYAEYLLKEWEQRLFPLAGEVMKKNVDYQDEIVYKARKGDYSMITAIEHADDSYGRLSAEIAEEGPYVLLKEITLPMSKEYHTIRFYSNKDLADLSDP